ncbi:uncharacterized protein LOC129581316 [Paramacrobiotus metropolitanus]|uniref:uncharacterized protein LOC129581316 n=1 Tax=Paramacrobiotus metropolitanus TaxID=2943436 RepID=UPI002445E6A9|nr:uncharacterized protein LOC129581316 [Paramacrobiotus metropolitanus]
MNSFVLTAALLILWGCASVSAAPKPKPGAGKPAKARSAYARSESNATEPSGSDKHDPAAKPDDNAMNIPPIPPFPADNDVQTFQDSAISSVSSIQDSLVSFIGEIFSIVKSVFQTTTVKGAGLIQESINQTNAVNSRINALTKDLTDAGNKAVAKASKFGEDIGSAVSGEKHEKPAGKPEKPKGKKP